MVKITKFLRIGVVKPSKIAKVGVANENLGSRLVKVTKIPKIGGVNAFKSRPTEIPRVSVAKATKAPEMGVVTLPKIPKLGGLRYVAFQKSA